MSNHHDNIQSDRLCCCDCQNGRFVTNLTRSEIEYIFEVVTKHNATSGDFVASVAAEGALEKLGDMKSYIEKPDRDQ